MFGEYHEVIAHGAFIEVSIDVNARANMIGKRFETCEEFFRHLLKTEHIEIERLDEPIGAVEIFVAEIYIPRHDPHDFEAYHEVLATAFYGTRCVRECADGPLKNTKAIL